MTETVITILRNNRPSIFFVWSRVMEQSATWAASPICVAAVFQTFSENILV